MYNLVMSHLYVVIRLLSLNFFLNHFLFVCTFDIGFQNYIVRTKVGPIRGVKATDGDYTMYLGVPYAKVNKSNPFGASIPNPRFESVFEAFDDTITCPQIEEFNNTYIGILDCLVLNIYVPNSASSTNLLPIFAYIHGGDFEFGITGRFMCGPRYLVRHDIIVITMNYRLGPYGFFCLDTPEVPGNQGLRDQSTALKWIRDNIYAFGGDPDRVTLSGHSAGAICVDFHLYSKQEKLYKNIIVQSSPSLLPKYLVKSDVTAPIRLASHLGFITNDTNLALNFLAKANVTSVIDHADKMNLGLKPCVEKPFHNADNFLTDHIINLKAPKAKNINVLIGNTDRETFYMYENDSICNTSNSIFYDELKLSFDFDNDTLKEMEKIVRRFYLGDEEINSRSKWRLIDFTSDLQFYVQAIRSIKKYIENGAHEIFYYIYSFLGESSFVKNKLNLTDGPSHGDELGTLFDMFYLKKVPTRQDQVVIDSMTALWANFVKFGNPTPALSKIEPKWKPITDDTFYYMNITEELSLGTRPFHERMAFWHIFYKLNKKFEKNIRKTDNS